MDTEQQAVWQALSDPTRREILNLLRGRPRTTGEVSSEFPTSRIAVMRHLSVLSAAGLVTSRKRGRQRWHYVNLAPLVRVLRSWHAPQDELWASALLRLKDMAELNPTTETIDLAVDVDIDAPPSRVFEAITRDFAAWWGHPFLRPDTTSLSLQASLGGPLTEVWPGGGQVIASVTGISTNRWLQMTGSFHLGVVLGVAEFDLRDEGRSTRLSLTFRGFGLTLPEVSRDYHLGWRELITVRLKRFIEEGVRLGIDKGRDSS